MVGGCGGVAAPINAAEDISEADGIRNRVADREAPRRQPEMGRKDHPNQTRQRRPAWPTSRSYQRFTGYCGGTAPLWRSSIGHRSSGNGSNGAPRTTSGRSTARRLHWLMVRKRGSLTCSMIMPGTRSVRRLSDDSLCTRLGKRWKRRSLSTARYGS